MDEVLRSVIAAITVGAAEGAAALRDRGVAIELDVFSIEARVDASPTALVRLDFVPVTTRTGQPEPGQRS